MSLLTLATLFLIVPLQGSAKNWLVYQGNSGLGKGKQIVFLAGDEEYRSEEGLPQLARILAVRHGFKCTVLFSINKQGEIDPNTRDNEPGMEALDSADLCVMLLRFREWPDDQMRHFANYYLAGKPIIALRTSTHAFDYSDRSVSTYRKFGWRSKEWIGGFGKQVLGETWIDHWGVHGKQATRGIVAQGARDLPIFRGVKDVFGKTDVYEAQPPSDAEILLYGQVLSGMDPTSTAASYRRKTARGSEQDVNFPMMPVAWIRENRNEAGSTNKILTCTMGAAVDLQNKGLRRFLVNGAYWAVGLEKEIPRRSNVDLIGPYAPSMFGFDGFRKGVTPESLSH